MPSPFPGMDPYLEDKTIWPGFHQLLAGEIMALLNPLIGPRYYADVEVQTILEEVSIAATHTIYPDTGILERLDPPLPGPISTRVAEAIIAPDAPIHRMAIIGTQVKLRTVKVFITETNQLVTAIELLSPYNKRHGGGLNEYRQKRFRLLRSPVHFVELDLLRGGERPGPEVEEPPLNCDYVLLVNRAFRGDGRMSDIWPVALNEPLPLLPIPLLPPDGDVVLDLGTAVRSVYTKAGYDWRIEYHKPIPPPALRSEMAQWAEHLIHNTLTKKEKHDI